VLIYVTDGSGRLDSGEEPVDLGQYDVLIVRPDAARCTVTATTEPLRLLSFYLPTFVPS
jgi:mannose-6-phosphate isomerase-like protein (cupin superfamily)